MSRNARKFKAFFRPKLGDLQKTKKKGRNPKFKAFFRPKLGDLQKKKKKGLHQNCGCYFVNSDV